MVPGVSGRLDNVLSFDLDDGYTDMFISWTFTKLYTYNWILTCT